jgi:hypothetical protein
MFDPATSIGSYGRAIETAALTRQRIDSVRVVAALHRSRARYGAWPASLERLVPEFLDAVPLDPYDGAKLRYAVRDGEAVLWSIGPNRVDDGAPDADRSSALLGLRWFAPSEQLPEGERSMLDLVHWPRAIVDLPTMETKQ